MAAVIKAFKRGDRVRVKDSWRKQYVGCTTGEVLVVGSLGTGAKVRWDGREIEGDQDDWIATAALEPEKRR